VRGAIFDGVREMAYLPRKAHAHRRAAEALDRAAEEEALARATDPKARADASAALAAVDEILARTCAAFVISVVGQDDASTPPGPEEALIGGETRTRVRAALEVLDERERTLVEGYYFDDRTLDELGAEMGISKSWASRICGRALSKMRAALERGE
jgi:RNA polymerase sigma factor for flagellar operon FliA